MAYESTVTSVMKEVERVSQSLGMYCGKCNVTNYNSTLIEITGITKYFISVDHTGTEPVKYPKGVFAVTPNGLSDNGHMFEWDATNGAFKVYKPTSILQDSAISGQVLMVDAAGGTGTEIHATNAAENNIYAVAAEVANNCDCGEITFTAIGFVR